MPPLAGVNGLGMSVPIIRTLGGDTVALFSVPLRLDVGGYYNLGNNGPLTWTVVGWGIL